MRLRGAAASDPNSPASLNGSTNSNLNNTASPSALTAANPITASTGAVRRCSSNWDQQPPPPQASLSNMNGSAHHPRLAPAYSNPVPINAEGTLNPKNILISSINKFFIYLS